MNREPKMMQILDHPAADSSANTVAHLISGIGLILALLGLEASFHEGWIATLSCWTFGFLGICTFALGFLLRYSCQDRNFKQ